jgi:D-lyxose ketol-isomerase
MKSASEKKKILELLKESPFLSYACKKTGVGRSTLYRWMENKDFKSKVNKVINQGREKWIDIAEMGLLKKVNNGEFQSITFFLSHNAPRYRPLRTSYIEPKSDEEETVMVLEEGQTCPTCNHKKQPGITTEQANRITTAFRNFGLIKEDENSDDTKNSNEEKLKTKPDI